MAKDIYNRSMHVSQSYGVTYFGRPIESGPSGYGKRLEGSYPAYVLLQGLGAIGTYNVGDVGVNSWPFSVINHVAIATATVTISLYDPKDVAFTPIVLVNAGALAAVGPLTLIATTQAPITRDLAVKVVVAGASAANAKISLGMVPMVSDWS